MLWCVFSCRIIKVFSIFHFCVFSQFCLVRSFSICAIWIWYHSIKRLQLLVITCTQCDLVNIFCKYIVCFTLEPLLWFQYCFLTLQILQSSNLISCFCTPFFIPFLINTDSTWQYQRDRLFNYSPFQFIFHQSDQLSVFPYM